MDPRKTQLGSSAQDSRRTRRTCVYDYYTNGEFDFYSLSSSTGFREIPSPIFCWASRTAISRVPLAASNIRSKSTYVFGQDEWHVSKKLVLTMGLRYEYNTPKV